MSQAHGHIFPTSLSRSTSLAFRLFLFLLFFFCTPTTSPFPLFLCPSSFFLGNPKNPFLHVSVSKASLFLWKSWNWRENPWPSNGTSPKFKPPNNQLLTASFTKSLLMLLSLYASLSISFSIWVYLLIMIWLGGIEVGPFSFTFFVIFLWLAESMVLWGRARLDWFVLVFSLGLNVLNSICWCKERKRSLRCFFCLFFFLLRPGGVYRFGFF